MLSLIVVIAFPLIITICFALLFFAYRSVGATSRFDDHGLYWYPLLLLIPLAAVLLDGWSRTQVGSALSDLGGKWAPALAVGGVALGGVLYAADKATAGWGVAAHTRERGTNTILEGRAGALQRFRPPPPMFLWLAVVVVGSEEIVWRGYLIRALERHGVAATAIATVLAAVLYGVNHYYFGLRNIGTKAFHGVVWGFMFVQSGSLLLPVVSHMTFEMLVGRQFWIRAPTAKILPGP